MSFSKNGHNCVSIFVCVYRSITDTYICLATEYMVCNDLTQFIFSIFADFLNYTVTGCNSNNPTNPTNPTNPNNPTSPANPLSTASTANPNNPTSPANPTSSSQLTTTSSQTPPSMNFAQYFLVQNTVQIFILFFCNTLTRKLLFVCC